MTKEELQDLLSESFKSNYLNSEDVEELVYNPELCEYFDKAMGSIPVGNFHSINKENDKKLFAKQVLNWIKNYDPELKKNPADFAKIIFKVFQGEDIESCSDPHAPIYSKIQGRKDIVSLQDKKQ
jgi:hypothetical protein